MINIVRSALILSFLGAALAAQAQNLVQDGDFESAGGNANSSKSYTNGETIDGGNWTVGDYVSGTIGIAAVTKSSTAVISGATSFFFYNYSLRQTLDTVASQAYLVSFDAYGASGTLPAAFSVTFGETTTAQLAPRGITSTNNPPTPVTHFSFVGLATSASTLLKFDSRSGDRAQNRIVLDNVQVTAVEAVPEPSALAALGLGGLALLKRRKRA